MAEFASRQAQAESSYLLSPARPERTAPEPAHAPDPLVVQQQALGNQAIQRLANQCPLKLPSPALCPTGGACHACPAPLQAKLTVNEPGDPYEQEADRIAEEVMRQPGPVVGEPPIQRQCQDCDEEVRRQPAALEEEEEEEEAPVQAKPVAGTITPLIQRQTASVEEEEEEEEVEAKGMPGATPQMTPAGQAQVNALRGGGQPLPAPLRSFFEPRFGHDFRGVRVHADAAAATTAQAVRARAFTLGRDVVFGSGQYAPETESGRKLLAHELVHVVQQGEPLRQDGVAQGESGTVQRKHECEQRTRGSCTGDNHKQVLEAFKTAAEWLGRIRYRVEDYTKAPDRPENSDVAAALKKHFGWDESRRGTSLTGPDVPRQVDKDIGTLYKQISIPFYDYCGSSEAGGKGSPKGKEDRPAGPATSPGGAAKRDDDAGQLLGWTGTNCYIFYPLFFTRVSKWGSRYAGRVVLHEMAHSWLHADDVAYEGEKRYPPTVGWQSLLNADSYACFIRDIQPPQKPARKPATGGKGAKPPR